MIKSDSLAKLAPALVKAQKNMGAALKDSKNPFFKSKYADLNAVIDAAVPALNEQGIAVLQSPAIIQNVDGSTTSVINTVLLHESGEFIAGQSKVVAAKANDPQAEGSAQSYAKRYGLRSMVVLKDEDDDGEAAMARPVKSTSDGKTEPKVEPKKMSSAQAPVKDVQTSDQKSESVKDPETGQPLSTVVKKAGWGSKKAIPKTDGDLY